MGCLRRGLAIGPAVLALILGLCASPILAGEQGDRAVAAVRRLVAEGQLRPDTVLRLLLERTMWFDAQAVGPWLPSVLARRRESLRLSVR